MDVSSPISQQHLARRRGDYGFDAPYVPLIFILIGLAILVMGLLSFWQWQAPIPGVICIVYSIFLFLCATSYIYTTRRGKFQVWARILSQLGLRGDEQILDLGCGRGAVLLMAASFLPNGKATGVDIWKTSDQSGNDSSVTQKNAKLEGVADRITLQTADMRQLPFANDSFDLVLSSLAIHNIHPLSELDKALDEAVRVLRPGGRLAIADIRNAQHYAEHLRKLGMVSVTVQGLGWRFWYGGPWMMTKLVQATKPS